MRCLSWVLTLFVCASVVAAELDDVSISATPVGGSVYMLQGAGGNIGVSSGEDGILIIDDQFAPMAEKIAAALGRLNQNAPRYVINTHYHGDHTGGNAFMASVQKATIFAHDNVRERLLAANNIGAQALPVVTYADGIKFHFNAETIRVMHLPSGHTDGDSVVWFEQANVLHTGDLFFESRFPYIDLDGGGTVDGYVQNAERLIAMLGDNTQVIPGHGALTNKAGYQIFVDMIKSTAAFVRQHRAAGKSLDDIVKIGLEPQWASWSWDFINEEKWIATLYRG